MKKTNDGFILLPIFLLIFSLLTIGTVIFYCSVHSYHIAQKQYHYYQKKYLVEGLLRYAVDQVTGSFKSYCVQKETLRVVHEWAVLGAQSCEGIVKTFAIDHEKLSRIIIHVTLRVGQENFSGSCSVLQDGNTCRIEEWMLM